MTDRSNRFARWARRGGWLLLAWLLAVVAATLLGSIVQTQFNLAALQSIGVDIPLGVRLQTTGADLIGFTPSLAPILAAGFLIAFVVAAGLTRLKPAWRSGLYAAAGFAAVLVALLLMEHLFELTPIAAARTALGLLALCACGAVGGALFARITHTDQTQPGHA